ncbi:MAG: AmmeMemoRadiSam system protein B [Candidatus Riflebacteria bacterium]|nr:AmmeMemoRadiSam system protein B [Candidatus Riflebacteria bacterium]
MPTRHEQELRPTLRPVEARPIATEDGDMIALKDPSGLAGDVVMLSPAAFVLATMMDGEHTLLDIQAEFCRRTGEILPSQALMELIGQLDQRHFLDSPTFQEYVRELSQEFAASPVRPTAFAGRCYKSDPQALREELTGYFISAEGPGALPGRGDGPVVACMAPHIDLPRGGPVYAFTYSRLQAVPPDLVVVLGTSHQPTGASLTFTRKNYDTPLGAIPTATDVLDRLEPSFGDRLYAGEFAHRSEHSIEFQAVFLRHLWEHEPFQMLPILCGALQETLSRGALPEDDTLFTDLVQALREVIMTRNALVIASVDLSHVGPQFGDPDRIDAPARETLELQDRAVLEPLLVGDRKGFWERVWVDQDKNRLCGFVPIYTLLSVVGPVQGELLAYRQWPDPDATVSFASMVFTETSPSRRRPR